MCVVDTVRMNLLAFLALLSVFQFRGQKRLVRGYEAQEDEQKQQEGKAKLIFTTKSSWANVDPTISSSTVSKRLFLCWNLSVFRTKDGEIRAEKQHDVLIKCLEIVLKKD